MSRDPDPDHLTHPVVVWLRIAQRPQDRGDDALAATIRAAIDRRRLDEFVSVDLTDDERARVQTVLAE